MIAESLQIAAGLAVAATAGQRVNHHAATTPLIDLILWSVLGAAGVMAVLAVPISLMPVVIDFQAEMVEHRPGLIRQHALGFKPIYQKNCEFIDIDAYVIDANGRQLKAPLVMENTPTPGRKRPPGPQDFGVWLMTYPPGKVITKTLFTAEHKCAWWMPVTRTTLGPFNIARARVEEPTPEVN